MHILHLVHQYPPHFIGGTELYTQNLARYQALAGHEVSVFCPFPDIGADQNVHLSLEQGVRVYRLALEPRSRSKVFFDFFNHNLQQNALKFVLYKNRPDIVHIQHLMGMPAALVDDIAMAGIPIVLTLHDYWYVCANAQLLTNTEQEICAGPDGFNLNCARCALARSGRTSLDWMAPGAAPLMGYRNHRLSHIMQQASRIIAPTHFVYQIYAGLDAPVEKMTVVKHGLELPQEKISAAREKQLNKQPGGQLKIGYIGGISRQKGLHILIEAVNGLPLREVELTIYGNLTTFPGYTRELRGLISHKNITLAGPIEHAQIWSTLAKFDIVVLPTLWYETSSLILDEAHAVGVPVIATRLGVMAEKIEDGVNGRLFSIADVHTLRNILKEVIQNPEVLSRWRDKIPTVRSIEDHVKEIEDVYHDAMHGL